MAKTVVILGSMDTKGEEFAYVKRLIEGHGINTLVVDSGVLGEPKLKPDVTHEELAKAGGKSLSELLEKKDRGEAMEVMSEGAAAVVSRLYREGKLDGIIGMGGSGGTAVATAGCAPCQWACRRSWYLLWRPATWNPTFPQETLP